MVVNPITFTRAKHFLCAHPDARLNKTHEGIGGSFEESNFDGSKCNFESWWFEKGFHSVWLTRGGKIIGGWVEVDWWL